MAVFAHPAARPIVAFSRVTRSFGPRMALLDCTVSLQPGVVGLLGPNGAGKTTWLNLAAGLLQPSSGQIRWFGDLERRAPGLDNRIGLATDNDQLPRRQTVIDWLVGMLRLAGCGKLYAGQRADQMLERLGLDAKRGDRLETLSRGQRQRVKLAHAFALPATLLLLDEPLNALDPVWRREVAALLHEAAASGTCVVVSSHILEEVEALASWLVLLFKGRLVAAGTLEDIRDMLHNRATVLRIGCQDARALGRELLAQAPVTVLRVDAATNRELTVQAADAEALCRALPRSVIASGVAVERVDTQGDDLVSLFQALAAEVR